MSVQYATIDRFPGYRIGDDGSVWSRWERTYTVGRRGVVYVQGQNWNLLKYSLVNRYYQVHLRNDSGSKSQMKVHILVLEAFVGPRPEGLQGLHDDDVRTNNNLSNLSWGTQIRNMADAARNGLLRRGETHPARKITDAIAIRIMELFKAGRTTGEISEEVGFPKTLVGNVVYGWSWNHVTGLPKRDSRDSEGQQQAGS